MSSLPARSSVGSTLPSVKYPILLQIIHEVADGTTARKACEKYGVSVAALRHHLRTDEELNTLFNDAIDIGSDALAELLVDIDAVHSNPAMASVISKNIQWLLERRKPEKFGARVQVSMDNNSTKEFLKVLDNAIARIPAANVPRLPGVTVTDVVFAEIVDDKKEPAQSPAQVDPLETLRQLGLA